MTAATKAQYLETYVSNMGKGLGALKEGAARLVTQHHKARERMNTFSAKVKEAAAVETVKELKTAFTAIGGSLSSLEDDHRRRMVTKLEKDFKAKADAFIPKLETQIKLMKFRNTAFTDKIDKEKYLRKQNDKPAPKPAKLKKASEDVTTASQTLVRAESDVNTTFTAFQRDRTAITKKMFEDMISAEIYFHARALETLTLAYSSLASIDPEASAHEMAMNLTHYDSPQDANPLPPGLVARPASGSLPQQPPGTPQQAQPPQQPGGLAGGAAIPYPPYPSQQPAPPPGQPPANSNIQPYANPPLGASQQPGLQPQQPPGNAAPGAGFGGGAGGFGASGNYGNSAPPGGGFGQASGFGNSGGFNNTYSNPQQPGMYGSAQPPRS